MEDDFINECNQENQVWFNKVNVAELITDFVLAIQMVEQIFLMTNKRLNCKSLKFVKSIFHYFVLFAAFSVARGTLCWLFDSKQHLL